MEAKKQLRPAPCTTACLSGKELSACRLLGHLHPLHCSLPVLRGGVAMGLASTLSTSFLMGGCQVRGMKENGLLGLLGAALKLVLAGGKGQAICEDDLDPQCCICQLWGSLAVCCPLLRAAVCAPSFLVLGFPPALGFRPGLKLTAPMCPCFPVAHHTAGDTVQLPD